MLRLAVVVALVATSASASRLRATVVTPTFVSPSNFSGCDPLVPDLVRHSTLRDVLILHASAPRQQPCRWAPRRRRHAVKTIASWCHAVHVSVPEQLLLARERGRRAARQHAAPGGARGRAHAALQPPARWSQRLRWILSTWQHPGVRGCAGVRPLLCSEARHCGVAGSCPARPWTAVPARTRWRCR
jgi:hypothetical protein